ncbi:MAG: flagellar basal-body rod protein FlgF [Paracoccaceae bacterium]|jgi:flagellar basal-body rod protein FlgF
MENSIYTTLTRQTGLMREMQTVANNIANMSTTGFRSEGVIFSEYVTDLDGAVGDLSMAMANGRSLNQSQGAISATGGTFDFAVEGDGFFLVETPAGEALTRAGHFMPNSDGELVTPDGDFLLDGGGARIFVPPSAQDISLAQDGTLSADGQPLTVIGLWRPIDALDLTHQSGVKFTADAGVEPTESSTILQGHLEGSNTDAITQISRMIEVQHAYEMGQGFLENEDKRLRSLLSTVGGRS